MVKDVADIASVIGVRTKDPGTDTDNVICRGDVVAGYRPQSRVVVARGVVGKRALADSRVRAASYIIVPALSTLGRVGATVVLKQCLITGGRVSIVIGVAEKCKRTIGRVLDAVLVV